MMLPINRDKLAAVGTCGVAMRKPVGPGNTEELQVPKTAFYAILFSVSFSFRVQRNDRSRQRKVNAKLLFKAIF